MLHRHTSSAIRRVGRRARASRPPWRSRRPRSPRTFPGRRARTTWSGPTPPTSSPVSPATTSSRAWPARRDLRRRRRRPDSTATPARRPVRRRRARPASGVARAATSSAAAGRRLAVRRRRPRRDLRRRRARTSSTAATRATSSGAAPVATSSTAAPATTSSTPAATRPRDAVHCGPGWDVAYVGRYDIADRVVRADRPPPRALIARAAARPPRSHPATAPVRRRIGAVPRPAGPAGARTRRAAVRGVGDVM